MAHLKKRNGHLLRTGPPGSGHLVRACTNQCFPLPSVVFVQFSGMTGDMVDGNQTWGVAVGGTFSIGIPNFAVNRTCGVEPLITCRGSISLTYSTNGTLSIQVTWGENPASTADRLAIKNWIYTFNPELICSTNQGSLVTPLLVSSTNQLILAPYDCLNYIENTVIVLTVIP